mmetsp:Transcript_13643/g.39826  ORF Transcript_13643/g.39826 Transcript_13643/m.39826 type:complete len:139 (+) Transcript_13643:214-630(+)
MRAAGATRIVALVKEEVDDQVQQFKDGFWGGEVFVDETKAFYCALGGGKEHKPFSGLSAFLAMILNPFSKSPTKASLQRAKTKGIQGNLTGEGFIAGGTYVMRPDGSSTYAFLEENMGDHPPMDDVLHATKEAAASAR